MALVLGTQTASASPTSAESDPPRWTHDVFLSFRGEDTRWGFMSHLDYALGYWRAMKIFKDDRDLEVGATISPELLAAIEKSRLAIIVLSPNYASSTWCLDELSKILECMEDTKRILPIFYHVDPSDVRNQRGSFAEAFTKHKERFSGDLEKLNQWRAALRKVANLTGLDSKTYKSEAELIEDIVKHVWKKVNPTFTLSDSEEKLVGIDFALDQLRLYLAPEENDVRFIGIWGMGGVGKTALANLVFQKISHHFEHFCFLSNVRMGQIYDLQGFLLSSMLKENDILVRDEGKGTFLIKNRLWNKKVLLVVDDVDQLNQLEKLVGEKNWFGVGSRIIITTRNVRILVEHDVAIRYKVEVLKNDEALELFSRHAFKKDQPEKILQKLSQEFLYYAKGLPLALKILGNSLYRRRQDAWESVLHNLRKTPDNPDIFYSLKVSYDGLTDMEKKIFLRVACLHRGKDKEQVIQILDFVLGSSSLIVIDILIEKSLLTIEKLHFRGNIVEMHDLIQEMAWRIVREESPQPGQRTLLWCRNDIFHVLMNNTGTGAIEGIVLSLPELEVVRWNCTEAFNEMHGLKLLDFDNVVFSSGPKFLPNSLRIIRWSRYPSKSLPSSFEPHLLAKLEMRGSKLVWLWDGTQDFPKLKYVDLSGSEKLISIPDFTGIPNLEELYLKGCKKLGEVHSSIASHKKLKKLTLDDCKGIKSLPSKLEMDSLEDLSLRGCSNVNKVPGFGEQMKNLSSLYLSETAIEQIPSSIEHLVGLEYLFIGDCKSLLGLPSSICNLKSLKILDGGNWKNLEHLTFSGSVAKSSTSKDGIGIGIGWVLDRLFGIRKSHPDPKPEPWGLVLSFLNHLCSLTDLDLSNCNIGEGVIPDDVGCFLSSLEHLYLSGNNFVSLPSSIRFLSNLSYLDLRRCERLEQLPDLPSSDEYLQVYVDGCSSLKRLSDPSKLSEGANVYDFEFSCLNCFRLVEEEDWINRIFAMLMRLAPTRDIHNGCIVWPGSVIPDWFDNQSAGDSITVELPLPTLPSCINHWVGIALCVVFQDSEYLENPAALVGYHFFQIQSLWGPYETFELGQLKSQHLWVFYLPRDSHIRDYPVRPKRKRDGSCSHRFSFEAFYHSNIAFNRQLKTNSSIKKCGARLVYEKDLEEFSRILKIPKPALPHAYNDEEAGPIPFGSNGSGSSDDEPGISSSDEDDEPISKRFNQV